MANWSYNGTVLPALPTNFGEYTAEYTYRAILKYNGYSKAWYAMAAAGPFWVEINQSASFDLCADYHGEYNLPMGKTEWVHTGNYYEGKKIVSLNDGGHWQLIWANHDVVNRTDGSVYMARSDQVSPDSVITKLTLNAAELQLRRGEQFQFIPQVTGTEIYSSQVTYSLFGNDARGGTTITRDGLLTIGDTEHASRFTVTVASRQDASVSRTVNVTVTDYQSKLDMHIVTDLLAYNGAVLPVFPTDWGEYTQEYTYRAIIYNGDRWWALAAPSPFWVNLYQNTRYLWAAYHGEYNFTAGNAAWTFVGNHYAQAYIVPLNVGNDWKLVWADHDVIDQTDGSVYLAGSAPAPLCLPVDGDSGTRYQMIGSTVSFDGVCKDLNSQDTIYTVQVWHYKMADGLDTTLPPTWTSEFFGGPTWGQRVTFTDLEPFTEYGVYGVVCVGGTATDHNWHGAFTTLQGDAAKVLTVEAVQTAQDGFTLSVTRNGLDAFTEYVAEVIVYHPDTSMVAFEGEMTFTGNGTDPYTVTGLEPDTRYAVSVDVYPAPTGAVVVRGDYIVTTGSERTIWNIFAGVSGMARPVRAVYVGVNGRARAVKAVYLGVNGRAEPL